MAEGANVIIIGAGIVGASIAWHLAQQGASVTVIDRAGIAAGASGGSFAWINANHTADERYFRLRQASLLEWHWLDGFLDGALGVTWQGAICHDLEGDALTERASSFRRFGYPVDRLD